MFHGDAVSLLGYTLLWDSRESNYLAHMLARSVVLGEKKKKVVNKKEVMMEGEDPTYASIHPKLSLELRKGKTPHSILLELV